MRYVECELNGTRLVPTNVEARYQLAYLYLQEGFLDLANELLQSNEANVTARPLSEIERTLLEKIVSYGKVSTESLKIKSQIRALYLLERDALTPREEAISASVQPPSQARHLEKTALYEAYLKRLGHITPLNESEEIFLLQQLQNSGNIPQSLQVRVAELAGKEPEEVIDLWGGTPTLLKSHTLLKTRAVNSLLKLNVEKLSPKRLDYYVCRKRNTFPFDYTKPSKLENGFREFYSRIAHEVNKRPCCINALTGIHAKFIHYNSIHLDF